MAFDLGTLMKGSGLAGGLGGLAGLFGFGPKQQNPSDAANQYINQIPGQAKPYYQPYMDAGNQSMQQLMQMLGQNPSDIYNTLGAGYKESPGYQHALKEAMQAQGNASARGGMLGTPQDQQLAAETGANAANKDFDNYMQQVLGLNTQKMQGLGQMTGIGYGASTGYGNLLSNVLGQQGANAYQGQKGQNETQSQNWSNIFNAIPWLFM